MGRKLAVARGEPARSLAIVGAVAVLIAAAAFVNGCGDDRQVGSPSSTPPTLPPPADAWFNDNWEASKVMALIEDGEAEAAGEMIVRRRLTGALEQQAFLEVAACHPKALRYLVEEVGLSPTANDGFQTLVYSLTMHDPVTDESSG